MATDAFLDEGSVRITGTEAKFGPRTYDLGQVRDVIGTYERTPVAWFGAALAVAGVLVVVAKGLLPLSETDALYQFLNTVGLPFVGVGAALFLFMSRYTVKLQTESGTVQVLSARNRAYAQRVSDALVAALKSRTAPTPDPRRVAPAPKSKR